MAMLPLHFRSKPTARLLAFSAAFFLSFPALRGDITIGDNGSFAQDSNFAGSLSPDAVGGEYFTAPVGATALTSFTFNIELNTGTTPIQAYAVAYNSVTGATGPIYTSTSPSILVNNNGFSPMTFAFNVPVTANSTYIVFLSSLGLSGGTTPSQILISLTNPPVPNPTGQTAVVGNLILGDLSGSTIDGTMFTLYSGTWDADFSATFMALIQGFNLDPNQQAVLNSINTGLGNGVANPNFTKLVTALLGQGGNLGTALDELSPEAFGHFTSQTAFNNASFETEAMDNYLAGQRGSNGNFLAGNGSIDTSGLTLNDPSYDPGLAAVHRRLLAWNPAPFNGTVSDVAGPVLGGVELRDDKEAKTMASAPAYSDPWNFFVRGNVILGQGFSNQDVSHFDDNTESVVLGTDYRFTPNFLMGLTAGYGHTDVTLDDNGSSATVDSYSPGIYASYADKGWYANFNGDYVHNAYTQSRVIGFLGQIANSAPEGNQGTANLDGGYDFHAGALTYGPLAGVQYTHLTVDGYQETGSIADLNVNDDQSDSLRSRLGGRVSYAFADAGMIFTPHLDASWQHEFLDQGRGITSSLNGSGLGSFSVRTTNPSRDSALADVGLDAQFDRTWTVFADYEVQGGQDNYFGQSVQAGVKIGF
jgi:uncharacterized protein YhjY with autotransporter beta-barrel domain